MAKNKKQYKIIIDEDFCKGCNICMELCNLDVFDISKNINSKGYYVPLPIRIDNCNGCGICDLSCPELAVILWEDKLNGLNKAMVEQPTTSAHN